MFFYFHTKSKVFQTHKRSQAFFSKFDAMLESWGMIFNSNTLAATGLYELVYGWIDGWTWYQKCAARGREAPDATPIFKIRGFR